MNKATNSALMRAKNEKIILSLINKAPISRVDISKITGLTKAAVTIIVDDLKKRDIIREQKSKSNAVGRNPVMLYLNPDAYCFVGVNISRTTISVGLVNLLGKVLSGEEFDISSPDTALNKIAHAIENVISQSGVDKDKIHKISVVSPGPVDSKRGVILNPPNFNGWHNVEVSSKIYEITGIETVLENVSSATAIAEKYFGSARSTENFLSLIVDEGIGAAIISSDTLFKGPCELGHVSIDYNGIKCECGNIGCLEKYAAIPCILAGTEYKNWQEVVEANDVGLMKREAQYISSAIISARNIFNFDSVVLCGDLTYKPKTMIDLVTDQIQKRILAKDNLEISAGDVKSKYIIASSVAIYDFFN